MSDEPRRNGSLLRNWASNKEKVWSGIAGGLELRDMAYILLLDMSSFHLQTLTARNESAYTVSEEKR